MVAVDRRAEAGPNAWLPQPQFLLQKRRGKTSEVISRNCAAGSVSGLWSSASLLLTSKELGCLRSVGLE